MPGFRSYDVETANEFDVFDCGECGGDGYFDDDDAPDGRRPCEACQGEG